MNPLSLSTSVTVTVTAAHLAGGVRGCAAECPLALALSAHDAIRLIPGAEIIVGGDRIDLYRGDDLVLVARNDRRTREWLERWDSDEETAAPFTTTLTFESSRKSTDWTSLTGSGRSVRPRPTPIDAGSA